MLSISSVVGSRSSRRLLLSLGLVLTAALAGPVGSAPAAQFCVHDSRCHGKHPHSLRAAVAAAKADGPGRDRIVVGRGRWNETVGQGASFSARRNRNPIELVGSRSSTTLVANSSNLCFNFGPHSSVRRLTIRTTENCPVTLVHASADHVRVVVPHNPNGAGFAFYLAGGARLSHSSVLIPATGELAVLVVNGRSLIEDSNLRAPFGVQADGGVATVRRSRITATFVGTQDVSSISDSTVRIRGDGTGLAMDGCQVAQSRLEATNVTLIGDGTPGSVGVEAASGGNPRGCSYHNAVHAVLTSSIVRGFAVSLHQSRSSERDPGQPPSAPPVSITTSYSDYDSSRTQTNEPGFPDAQPIHSSHDVNVDPRFVNPRLGDLHLRFDSPVLGLGAPSRAARLGNQDIDRHRRVVDADHDGQPVIDMGAHEYQGTGPRPVIAISNRRPYVFQDTRFNGVASSDPDGGSLHYSWQFGDRRSGTGRHVTHHYTEAGVYRIYLTVRDYQGLRSFTTRTIKVRPAPVLCGHRC